MAMDRLWQLVRAGDVKILERRARLAQDAGRTVRQAVNHAAIIRRTHQQQMRRRPVDARRGGEWRIFGAHPA